MAQAQTSDDFLTREKFSPQGYNDGGCAIIFLVHVVAIFGWIGNACLTGRFTKLATIASSTVHTSTEGKASGTSSSLLQLHEYGVAVDPAYAATTLMLLALGLAFAWALLWIMAVRTFPEKTTYASLGFFVVILGIAGVISLASLALVAGFIFCALAALMVGYIFYCGEEIRFTSTCLKCVSTIYTAQTSIFCYATAFVVLQVLWVLVTSAATVALFEPTDNQDESKEKTKFNGAMGIVMIFSFYWGTQVISNTLHVACAGVVARWYFNKQVDDAVPKSVCQASTNYFGSICFGSLLIAIIQTIRRIVEASANRRDHNGNLGAEIMAAVAVCMLRCIESIARLFNSFAFVIVSIYGVGYVDAGRRVVKLFSEQGLELLSKYNLTSVVCFVAWFVGALAVAATIGAAAWVMQLPTNLITLLVIAAFLTTVSIVVVVCRVVESGVESLLVCFAEEGDKLESSAPEVYDCFKETTRIRLQ
eukprot:TRINITY_DN4129_c0_g1_i1.p1 TRINITY_DN4129_c0_g1~~TRINITY_DN4129_c0_g1_i1.p1  ORF type:complete len:501 (+),score=73.77 TRINITY_DN4129_c0_g1_i1:74-1504(+)